MAVTVREKIKGSGIWWLFVSHNGRRTSKKIGNKDTAEGLAIDVKKKLDAGDLGILEEPVKPFSFFCKEWKTEIMPVDCKESTQSDYIGIYNNHLKAAPFFSTPVDKITEDDVEKLFRLKRKTLSRSTVIHIKNAISNSFKRAIKARVLRINPCTNAEIPKERDDEGFTANPYDQKQIEELLAGFEDNRFHTMLLFFVRTGCRASEVAALQWKEIDLDKRKANICRGIVRGKLVESTKGKRRTIDLTPQLVQELRKSKLRQESSEWVFQDTKGNRVDMGNFRNRVFNPMTDSLELHRTRLHDLRHSYASLVIGLTKDMHYAQKMLGHASITTTINTYGHLLEHDGEVRIVDILDAPHNTPTAPKQKKELAKIG